MIIEEKLTYSRYAITEERQSKIDPDVSTTVETGFKCPRCKTPLAWIGHSEKSRCDCGVKFHRLGNILECSLEMKDGSRAIGSEQVHL
jgi:hypothetical protein